ncbi:hypothetical protein ACFQZC_17345 [Streptacidiphilus monticola]
MTPLVLLGLDDDGFGAEVWPPPLPPELLLRGELPPLDEALVVVEEPDVVVPPPW